MGKARKTRGTGKGVAFLAWALDHETDECIEWPFYIMREGYGQVGTHEGMELAHRYVCKRAHGDQPFEGAQAAHWKCGNKRCVNKRHIRWSTATENEHDKLAHGTWFERFGGAKLNAEIVGEIRREAKSQPATKATYTFLAEKYRTPVSTIKKVVKGHTWKHVA